MIRKTSGAKLTTFQFLELDISLDAKLLYISKLDNPSAYLNMLVEYIILKDSGTYNTLIEELNDEKIIIPMSCDMTE